MMHYQSIFALLAAAVGSSIAQSTSVVSLYIQPTNPHPAYVGSIISVEPSATVYAVNCAPGANRTKCDFPGDGPATIKQGPSTFEGHLSGVVTTSNDVVVTLTEKVDANCALTPSPAVAVCTNQFNVVYVIGSNTSTTTSSAIATSTNWSTGLVAVTITAGLDKLSAAPSTTGGVPPASTSKPSAAGPRVTQQAVLAGAAAVVGAAVML